MSSKLKKRVFWPLLCLLIVAATGEIYGAGHGQPSRQDGFGHHEERASRQGHGDGASGTVSAWLFGIANFTVVLSVVLKTSAKMILPGSDLRKKIQSVNLRQKKYFRHLHYWLNPVAVIAAIIHFSVSECAYTFLPELGLAAMLLIIALGLLVLFKSAPPQMRKLAFRLHTSPVLVVATISILLIGHSMID